MKGKPINLSEGECMIRFLILINISAVILETGIPCRHNVMAGWNKDCQGSLPNLLCSSQYPRISPGIAEDKPPQAGAEKPF